MNWYPSLRACWMKRGQQLCVTVPSDQHHRAYLFGAYDWQDDRVYSQWSDHTNSSTFLTFLEHLVVTTHPDQYLILVLDNASYHKVALIRAFLSLVEHRVLMLFLPPYCSHLNPIERFWRFMKDNTCVNTLFPNFFALVDSINLLLHNQNDASRSDRFSFSKY